eukprot:scaffold13468_cov94-Isochrysis_galbana.AAC.1
MASSSRRRSSESRRDKADESRGERRGDWRGCGIERSADSRREKVAESRGESRGDWRGSRLRLMPRGEGKKGAPPRAVAGGGAPGGAGTHGALGSLVRSKPRALMCSTGDLSGEASGGLCGSAIELSRPCGGGMSPSASLKPVPVFWVGWTGWGVAARTPSLHPASALKKWPIRWLAETDGGSWLASSCSSDRMPRRSDST